MSPLLNFTFFLRLNYNFMLYWLFRFPPFKASDNGSWFRALGQCVSESQCALKEVSSDIYDGGVDAYNMLDSSIKLKLLNILCDEALCTM